MQDASGDGDEPGHDQADAEGDPVTGLQHEAGAAQAGSSLVERLRAASPALTSRIAAHVQAEVAAYAGPQTGRRRRLIEMATRGAVAQFLDTVGGGTGHHLGVDDLFRQMGHGEALDGNDLRTLNDALELAGRMARGQIREVAVQEGAPGATLSRLSELLDTQLAHLREQARIGHRRGEHALATDAGRARGRLRDLLLDGGSTDELTAAAGAVGWPLPSLLVVVTSQDRLDRGFPDLSILDDVLRDTNHDPAVFICSAESLPNLLGALEPGASLRRTAVSWPVTPAEAPDAFRWTQRALELARRGVLPDTPIIHCAEHPTQLWLHAEPSLRQRLIQELLPPLLAETPNSREILSETLLDWLQTRDSAPAIAARLDVHPQTVRYRWKRINELFGESLHDPEFIVQLTMLLKASVPLWKAGDQSDFERFRRGGAS